MYSGCHVSNQYMPVCLLDRCAVMSTPTPVSPAASPPVHLYTIDGTPVAVTLHEPAPDASDVPEALVQDLWRMQRFDTDTLRTTDGRRVRIYDPGHLNTDAGPDFSAAHVRIGDIDWRGDIEIHVTASGWVEHAHDTDARYNSVVLHVTLQADAWTGNLEREDGSTLPEVVLYPRLEAPVRSLLHDFHTRPDSDALPCASRWKTVPDPVRDPWIEQCAERRMTDKRDRLAARSDTTLACLLHERLFAGLGYAKNDEPMTTLAQRLPLDAIADVDDPTDLEALHLGVAGLIPTPADLLEADRATADTAVALRHRFERLTVHREVTPLPRTRWTFFRLRPTNFPPLRIAQAVAWLRPGGLLRENPIAQLRDALQHPKPLQELRSLLQAEPSAFWRTHFHLRKSTSERDPSLGRSRIDTLITNAVLPVLLLDADRNGDDTQSDAVFDILRALPAARDSVTRRFRDLGTRAGSAFETQGLHHLYRAYCEAGGCLQCDIGQWLLNGTSSAPDDR